MANRACKRILLLSVASMLAGAFGCNDSGGPIFGRGGGVGGPSTSTGSTSTAPSGGNLITCDSYIEGPCGAFETPTGTRIELGPYGSTFMRNVGDGFPNTVALGDADGGVTCALFAGVFGEDPALTAQLLDTSGQGGTGSSANEPLNFALYTVYRPANMIDGERYPVITWGNGTCAQPGGYSALLHYVASHGFIVVAANSRWVGGATEMRRGLDFIFAENDNPQSVFYQRVDTEHVGAMGHSQGSAGTAAAAADPRVDAVILWNGGTSASKKFLAVSGDLDVFQTSPTAMRSAVNGASTGGAFIYIHNPAGQGSLRGHLTLMLEPERIVDVAAAWWLMTLKNDPQARQMFVGTNCGLCNQSGMEFGQRGL